MLINNRRPLVRSAPGHKTVPNGPVTVNAFTPRRYYNTRSEMLSHRKRMEFRRVSMYSYNIHIHTYI